MEFTEIMRAYFRGEATEAWFFILPAGLLLIGVGGALLSANRTPFDWGLAVPCVVFGLILASVGIGVGARTPKQVEMLEASYRSAPAVMVKDELPRMQKVMKNFQTTLVIFGVLAAVGLALIYGLRREWSSGLGVALVLGGAIGLAIDNVAERRGRPYVSALEKIAADATATP